MNTDDLVRMGKAYAKLAFITAGNVTHDPAYGNIIMLGVLDATQRLNVAPEQTRNAAALREDIARTGRFVTFSQGGAPIGFRMRPDPAERNPLRIVKETDAGLVLQGKVGMHTSPAFADDVYIGSSCNVDYNGSRATFLVPTNAEGVTVVCRKMSIRHENSFIAPLSSRFDELDGQMWLDDVFIPWERIFFTEKAAVPGEPVRDIAVRGIASWLYWHQIYDWLGKAEFTLGIALACADAMGLKEHERTIDYLVDLISDVETAKTCMTASELDPDRSVAGYAMPNNRHVASRRDHAAQVAPAHDRDATQPARLVAGRGAGRHRPGGSDDGAGSRGLVRRRRLHGAAAVGAAQPGLGPCVVGAGRARVGLRAARQRRHGGMAGPGTQPLHALQRAG